MQWLRFLLVWDLGIVLVCVQALCSVADGYFRQWSLRRRGVMNGYAFIEHGGMWADIFIISPVVAYATSKYHLAYASWYSIVIFIIVVAFIGAAGYGYGAKGEKKMPDVMLPDAYVHDGKTTPAGWIHLGFAVAVLYIIAMFYFTPLDPPASPREITAISLLLTPFFFLGVCKFTRRWKFSHFAKVQVAIQCTILWAITAFKLIFF